MDHRLGPHFLKASVGLVEVVSKDILNLVYHKGYGLYEVAEFASLVK